MSRFSEETFNNWRKPASESEEQRISNAISMIKDAVNASEKLKYKNIEIFVQGSYANDTNVKANSDVDVCVMLKDTFYSEYPEGKSDKDYGFLKGTNTFETYRSDLIKALNDKYGEKNVKPGNKSIKITETSYRVEADIVPSFLYRNYKYDNSSNPDRFKEGVKFYTSTDGNRIEVINYPKIHIENGIKKNKNTQKRYKRLVRIFKRVRYLMINESNPVDKGITSFLIECLLWNTPNSIFNDYDTWTERVKQAIIHLYNKTEDEKKCKDWREVSEMLYLFHNGRKWTVEKTNKYLLQMWSYLEFK